MLEKAQNLNEFTINLLYGPFLNSFYKALLLNLLLPNETLDFPPNIAFSSFHDTFLLLFQ